MKVEEVALYQLFDAVRYGFIRSGTDLSGSICRRDLGRGRGFAALGDDLVRVRAARLALGVVAAATVAALLLLALVTLVLILAGTFRGPRFESLPLKRNDRDPDFLFLFHVRLELVLLALRRDELDLDMSRTGAVRAVSVSVQVPVTFVFPEPSPASGSGPSEDGGE